MIKVFVGRKSLLLAWFELAVCSMMLLVCSLEHAPYERLKKCGFDPQAILDAGANVGEWTRRAKDLFPNAKFFMIDGNPLVRPDLEKLGHPFELVLVGDHVGNVTFYRQRGVRTATGNSIFKENSNAFTNSEEMSMKMSTIDEIITRRNVGPFQLLKLDVQGAELPALHGARKTLKTVEVIQTENAVMNYNEGSPSLLKLTALIENMGFAMFDAFDMIRVKSGILIQFDALWVRKTSPLWHMNCTGYPTPKRFATEKDDKRFQQCLSHA